MTAFTAIVLGLAVGYLVRERRKAYLVWLPIWALVLLGQTLLLARTDDSVDAVYPFIQAAIFLAGVASVRLGGAVRDRRGIRPWLSAIAPMVLVLLVAAGGVGCSGGSGAAGDRSSSAGEPLTLVALGDSWPEGAHCGGCRTFAGLYADGLEGRTGRPVTFVDLTGQAQPFFDEEGGTAGLLHALRDDSAFQDDVAEGDVIMIATGPNEMERAFKPFAARMCGKHDRYACIRRLESFWSRNFNAILDEIQRLRAGKPTAIRVVSAANVFVSEPDIAEGLPADAMTFGAKVFEALNAAGCDAARSHNAVCVDVRPILNGPTLDQPVDENSPEAMQAVATALLRTGIGELGIASDEQAILDPVIDRKFRVGSPDQELAIRCWGAGAPAVILDAGSSSSGIEEFGAYFDEIIRPLAERSMVCAYDRAGTGETAPLPKKRRTIDDQAEELNALLAAADVPKPRVLVGSSWGGGVAVHTARNYPDGIAAVVLLDVPAPNPHLNAAQAPDAAWDHPINVERVDSFHAERTLARDRRSLGDVLVTVVTADAGQSDATDQRFWKRLSNRFSQVVLSGGHVIYADNPDGVREQIQRTVEDAA